LGTSPDSSPHDDMNTASAAIGITFMACLL
jgi:hypothetical protein